MMYCRVLFVGILLGFSSSSFSQALISFQDCVNAIDLSKSYVVASTDVAQARAASGELSALQLTHLIQTFDDFQQAHSLTSCMAGTRPEIFYCLLEHYGDVSRCQQ